MEIDGKVVCSCFLLKGPCPLYVRRYPSFHPAGWNWSYSESPASTQDQLLGLYSRYLFLGVVFEFSFPLWQQPPVLPHPTAFDLMGRCPRDGFWAFSFSHLSFLEQEGSPLHPRTLSLKWEVIIPIYGREECCAWSFVSNGPKSINWTWSQLSIDKMRKRGGI